MRALRALFLLLLPLVSTANALVVGPEVPVTPPVYGPSTATASSPVVASDGSNYLVLWLVGNGPYDVKAAIVSPTGELQGIPQVLLPGADVSDLNAVWNGSSYLLAWFSSVQRGIVVVSVAPDGTLLDAPHVVFTAGGIQPRHALAWNGRNYLLTYTNGDSHTIGALLLSAAGDLVRNVSIPFPQQFRAETVAIGDTFYVLAFGSTGITVFRVSGNGNVVDAQPATVTTAVLADNFDVSTNGRTIVLAASEASALQTFSIDPATLQTARSTEVLGEVPYSVSIASSGSTFLVSWIRGGFAGPLRTLALKDDGSPAGALQQCCAVSGYLSMASNGSTYLAGWLSGSRIVTSLFTPDGNAVGQHIVSLTAAEQSRPAMAGSLLVWRESNANGGTDVHAVRTGPNGAVGDPIVVSQSFSQDDVAVVFTGSLYFIAWTDTATAGGDSHVVVRRFRTDLTPIDPAPIAITSAPSVHPSLAFDGTHVLAVWTDSTAAVRAVRVPDFGAPLDAPLTIAQSGAGNPSVAWNGSEYLVVWTSGNFCRQFFCGPNGLDVAGARLTADGVLLDATPIVIATGGADQTAKAVSSNGRDFVVGYEADEDSPIVHRLVNLRHVDANGAPGPELTIGVMPFQIDGKIPFGPAMAVVRRGSGYIVAYQTGPEDGPVEMHVAHLDDAVSGDAVFGTSRSFAEFALQDDSGLMAYTRFAAEPQYGGAQRLFTRTFASEPRLRQVRH